MEERGQVPLQSLFRSFPSFYSWQQSCVLVCSHRLDFCFFAETQRTFASFLHTKHPNPPGGIDRLDLLQWNHNFLEAEIHSGSRSFEAHILHNRCHPLKHRHTPAAASERRGLHAASDTLY